MSKTSGSGRELRPEVSGRGLAVVAWPAAQPAALSWGDEERDPVCTWEFARHAQLLDRQQRAARRR